MSYRFDTMPKISAFALVIFVCMCLVKATIITLYENASPEPMIDVLQCGQEASTFDYCAVRESSGTCYPLATDWCRSKDMSIDGAYLIKKTVVETVQVLQMYERNLPIILTDGSELEFRFKLQNNGFNWHIDLNDTSGNIVLHIKIRYPDDFYVSSFINGNWKGEVGYVDTFPSFTFDTEYKLRIMCGTNSIQAIMYLGDTIVDDISYTLQRPSDSIVTIFSNADVVYLDQVTYKAGQ